ncbi:hypothetical protein TEA_022628 [Camellia sinensis var. sinensis]|uniref:Endonuclease/exonuclease/phosphatase domain-containing protein n=1 Tax=Camellia sinensis var. sinensis TaxID=542762 RepID=A0A4S4DQD5_CAMSN|nr:hypothetical protein TEA_022628 [Camellia sinensis var. sinensis]
MLKILNRNLKRLCSKLRWPIHPRQKPKIIIQKLGKSNSKSHPNSNQDTIPNGSATVHPNTQSNTEKPQEKPIRIATFNAALFCMAPAIPKTESSNEDQPNSNQSIDYNSRIKSTNDRLKSILKQAPLFPNSMNDSENLSKQQKFAKSKLRVSINLPDNEISLMRSAQLSFGNEENEASSSKNTNINMKGKSSVRSQRYSSNKTIVEVLREVEADILGLQDVKAEEEKGMKPLADLAEALGMNYVFAESWAPEYGNAVLSKWPIKRWNVQKIFDDSDFRNVLKVTVDVPWAGEVNFHCTYLDHLDENWRMKQINAIIQSHDGPNILAGGLNSLDETDYSPERWTDIVKYYEEMGKPTPKVEVMRFLKSKQYTDAKDFAGECEPVVMIAKGQSENHVDHLGVQGTCKYGTRVDYILASSNSSYKFVPGSYSVFSSKGTSDHHIVKVDVLKGESNAQQHGNRKRRQPKQRIVKITNSSSKGIWKTYGER